MTKQSALVLEGQQIKVRLQAEQTNHPGYVHIDWLRFTVLRRNAPIPSVELLFPEPYGAIDYQAASDGWSQHQIDAAHGEVRARRQHLVNLLRDLPDSDYQASTQAFTLAEEVVGILGHDYTVDPLIQKGKDFYRFRFDILRKGHPVGWVGFLSTSSGQRGNAQSQTLHVNLEGMACTFGQPGWRDPMANLIDQYRGLITRIDLAIDFFDGINGGIERIPAEYRSGLMDHLGQRPGHKTDGTWECDEIAINKGRSFYLGSRAAGKLTNIYEKGIQLFGPETLSKWLRCELRWGNQKRILSSDMLRRPADFFSGASQWHAAILKEHGAQFNPVNVPCEARLQIQTIEAEAERNARWFIRTAGASARLAIMHLDLKTMDVLLDDASRIPGRLRKFATSEIEAVYSKVFKRIGSTGRAEPAFS